MVIWMDNVIIGCVRYVCVYSLTRLRNFGNSLSQNPSWPLPWINTFPVVRYTMITSALCIYWTVRNNTFSMNDWRLFFVITPNYMVSICTTKLKVQTLGYWPHPGMYSFLWHDETYTVSSRFINCFINGFKWQNSSWIGLLFRLIYHGNGVCSFQIVNRYVYVRIIVSIYT